LNFPPLTLAVAVIVFVAKYFVIDLLDSETEIMTKFKPTKAAARAKIETTEYLTPLAGLYLDISAREASNPPAQTQEERRETLIALLAGADYLNQVAAIGKAGVLISELDRHFDAARKAGNWSWLVGALAIVATLVWAGHVATTSTSLLADASGPFTIALLLVATFVRLRYEFTKRKLGELINEH